MSGFRKLFIICSFLVLQGFVAKAQHTPEKAKLDPDQDVRVGSNIEIPSKFRNLPLVEPSISAHPENNDQLLVAAMVVTDINRPYQSCRLSSFFSNDAGLSWEETAHDYWGYDPWTAIGGDGSAVMSWLGTEGDFRHEFPIQLFSSENGGQFWKNPSQSFNGFGHGHDGTKLLSHGDSFYLTAVRFNGDMSADVVLYHKKGSAAFEEAGSVYGKGKRLNFCEPAALSNGTVLIPTSHHQGNIWVSRYNPKTKLMSRKTVVSQNPKLGRGYMRMVADTGNTSSFRDRVYLVRAVASGRSSEGIWINISDDGGKTWHKERRLDLFQNPLSSKANVASVAVNQQGVLGVSWMDGQHDKEQKKYDLYFAISKDGGQSFQRPVRVTETSSDPRTAQNGDVANKFIGGGHYLGLTAKPDGSFQLVWSDSRSGFFKLQTCNIQIK